jgi:hypothetical protein
MDRSAAACFSTTYAQARRRFLDAAEAAGASHTSHPHPWSGREAEHLAVDVAIDGDAQSARILIVSSGCHGVEGFAGSAVQVSTLLDEDLRRRAQAAGVALVHIHGLNPHGFSHLRRTTEDNVDLNRNFHDFSRPLPRNESYGHVHPLLLPEQWPPPPANEAALMQMIQSGGVKALQAVVARGQHEFADGLFFGGTGPCWSNLTLRRVLRHTAGHASRLAWIDVHTGLGPSAVGERIVACESGAAEARARAWWGPGVTSIHDDSSTSTYLTGAMWTAARDECPNAEYTGIALEYGTVPLLEVLQALRADNWLHATRRHGVQPPEELAQAIRSQMMQAFLVDSDDWKTRVLEQAREAIGQAIDNLPEAV